MRQDRVRWVILALLFAATTLNYIDRQALSVLSVTLRRELQLTDRDYANVVTAFLIPYTVMYTVSGRLLDRVGVRMGLAMCLAWWSAAASLTALSRGAASLAAFRFLLGAGEPGIYPGGMKACREWFPRSQRALATGLFSSGSAVGAVAAPPLIAWLTRQFGWRPAFLLPGLAGLVWIPFWVSIYRKPPADQSQNQEANGESWRELLRQRRTWAVVLPRMIGDPVWYFYIFWLPDYLQRDRHLSLTEIGLYGWIPFLFADFGNIGGGALSDWLIRRGLESTRARLMVITGIGCLAPLGALVAVAPSAPVAIGVTCLAAFLCQSWSTTAATLAADLFPGDTATVTGMAGTAGSLGGVIFSQVLGVAIGEFGYPAAFVMAATLHPAAAFTLIRMLRGRVSDFSKHG